MTKIIINDGDIYPIFTTKDRSTDKVHRNIKSQIEKIKVNIGMFGPDNHKLLCDIENKLSEITTEMNKVLAKKR